MIKEIALAISIWSIVLPFIAGIRYYKRLNNDSKWIFCLVIFAMPPQLLSFNVGNPAPAWLNVIYNIYTPIEFYILFVLFYTKYEVSAHRLIVRLTAAVYPVFVLTFFICDGLTYGFINLLACVNNLIYIIWISLFLKEQYNVQNSSIEKANPFAWYLLAILTYASCSVIPLSLYEYIAHAKDDEKNLWIIHTICNTTQYILFAVGLSIPKQKQMIHEPRPQ